MTLLELFQLLKKHLKLVIALPVICAVAMGIVSFTMMDSTYTATTSMCVLAKTDDSGQMSYNDLSASQMLSNDIATLLDSDSVKGGAAKDLGLADLDDYKISVSSETTTRVITLYVAVTFLAGVFIAIAYVVLADMLNTRIRGVEEAEELLGIPVVG